MAHYVCEATPEQLENGYCPKWVEVESLTFGAGSPVDITLIGWVSSDNVLYAFAAGASMFIAAHPLLYVVREGANLIREALR